MTSSSSQGQKDSKNICSHSSKKILDKIKIIYFSGACAQQWTEGNFDELNSKMNVFISEWKATATFIPGDKHMVWIQVALTQMVRLYRGKGKSAKPQLTVWTLGIEMWIGIWKNPKCKNKRVGPTIICCVPHLQISTKKAALQEGVGRAKKLCSLMYLCSDALPELS